MSHIIKNIIFVFIFALCLPGIAHAQFDSDTEYNENEKIGFAFYTLSGMKPDFFTWAQHTEKYRNAGPTGKIQIANNDAYRLQNGYVNYNIEEDLIKLEFDNTNIKGEPFYVESRHHDNNTSVFVSLPDYPDGYFPFEVSDKWVALIIKDFDLLKEIIMDNDEYKKFTKAAGHNHINHSFEKKVNMTLTLKPISVDTAEPMVLEDMEMWLMLAEIGEMELWYLDRHTGREQHLWSYNAPWYVAEERQELLDLYKK